MALDFPASPTNGQVYPAPNGVAYQWQVPPSVWVAIGGSTDGGVPPSGPAGGDLAGTYPSPTIKPSVALTGNPTAPTPAAGDADTSIATTAFVQAHSGTISVPAERFGAVGDGVHDDTAALQAAIDFLYAQGGGQLQLTKRYLIDSADLNMRYGVTLRGFWKNFVKKPGLDYSTVQSCIVLNPLYTIRVMDVMCSIVGLVILKKGLQVPTNIRTALDQLKSYAGTAVTVGNGVVGDPGSDFYIGYTTIGGFAKAIDINGCSRPHVEWINFDCTQGIRVANCYEMDHIAHCHGWGFLQAHGSWNFTNWAIANVTNNGSGLIRVTTTAPHQLVTGDNQVFISEVVGVPSANWAWTVTVINSTTVDLQGSAFAGAYVSGGKLWAGDGRRLGSAYLFETVDWLQAHTIFEYGWDAGIYCVGCNQVTLLNIGCDNYGPALNPVSSGLTLLNCFMASVTQATLTSQGIGLYLDTTPGIANTITEAKFVANNRYPIYVVNGSFSFVNCKGDAATFPSGPIRIEAGASTVTFIGGDFTGITFNTAGPTPRFVQVKGTDSYMDTLTTPGDVNAANVTASGLITGSFVDATSMFRRHGLVGIAALFAGPTKGVRIGVDAAGASIEGVDNTGVGSFQPLTINGSVVNVSPIAVFNSEVQVTGANATYRQFALQTAGSNRWTMGVTNVAESGGNAGSDFSLYRFDDAGGFIEQSFSLQRSTGLAAFARGLVVAFSAAVAAGSNTQAFVKASATPNLGLYYGTGAPTFTAAANSLYMRTDGNSTTTRMYVNTTGSTTWATVATSA